MQPVYRGEDPAQALNEHLLGDVHAAIADRFGKSASDARALRGTDDGKGNPLLYKDLIVSHDHGELGPVLGVRGRPFTGASAVDNGKPPRPAPKPKPKAPAGRTPAQVQAELTALERNLPNLKTDQQRAYTRQRIETLRQQLG